MLTLNNSNVAETLQIQAKNELTNNILEESSHYLKGSQLMELNKTLNKHFQGYEIFVQQHNELHKNYQEENQTILETYLSNKKLEGLSKNSLYYYDMVLSNFLKVIGMHLSDVTTQDLRNYLTYYQSLNNASNASVDNVRRVLNGFFNTINNEGFIPTNPMSRIKHIKQEKKLKKPFTNFEIEKMRGALQNQKENWKYISEYEILRNKAIFELLLSSGIRVRELVNLNKNDIDLNTRTFTVMGKGSKERECYCSVKAEYYLRQLLNMEKSSQSEALFMGRGGNRMLVSGVETMIRNLGKHVGVKAHPHKFRRTFATNLINKGVPVEHVKEMLGHTNLDTTMIYAIVDRERVKQSHQQYIE